MLKSFLECFWAFYSSLSFWLCWKSFFLLFATQPAPSPDTLDLPSGANRAIDSEQFSAFSTEPEFDIPQLAVIGQFIANSVQLEIRIFIK